MKRAITKAHDWRQLLYIVAIGLIVGFGISAFTNALSPVITYFKKAPVEATAAAISKPLLPVPANHQTAKPDV